MKTIWDWIQALVTGVGGMLGWFFGDIDSFTCVLVAFVVIDYLTGVMCAVIEKKLSSEVGFRGIFKKITIFAMVGVGHMLDILILGPAGYAAIRMAVVCFYLANEGLSMLENVSRLGLPVPKKVKDALALLHEKDESK
jgi:toxin secretion/phage lysis holin